MLALLMGLAALPAVAGAPPPYRALDELHHTRWTIKDGAPGQISALAQTRDGMLWLTAAQSLYRFDGVRFERFLPTDGERLSAVRLLHATPDGALWMGFQGSGVARLADGRITRYDASSGAPSRTSYAFAVDHDGVLWVAANDGLFRFQDDRWQRIDQRWGYPGRKANAVAIARDGTMWVATEDTIVTLPRNAKRFVPSGVKVGWVLQLRQAADGRMWMTQSRGGVQPLRLDNGRLVVDTPRLDMESAGLLFASDGSLWITTLGDGLRRLREPAGGNAASVEIFTEKDGLSADYTWPIVEDREGNVWVGSSGGLDRFRASALVPAGFPRGSHDYALVGDEAGTMWAGTTNRPLMRLHAGRLSYQPLGEAVRCAYRDASGRLWLGGDRTLWRLQAGKARPLAALPSGSQQVQAMAVDRDGALWAGMSSGGLWRWHEGSWSNVSVRIARQPDVLLRTALSDRLGRLWFGLNDGDLVQLDGAQSRTYPLARTLKLGAITALAAGAGAGQVWIGGQFGLARFDGERVRALQIDSEEGLWGVSGIIELGNGDLWVHAVPGIFRLPVEQLRQAQARPGHRMRFDRFDFLDGLPARPTLIRPLPTSVAGSDGRLWFATSNGVVWIDPRHIARNPLPPPVAISAVRANGRDFGSSNVRLPVGARNVEIAYTGLSLAIPARMNFRYRLEGFDDDWQDVGNRRTAYYGRLPPGDYRFQVIAANNDGVWNDTGASLSLQVPPAFYQTWWFRGLCLLAAMGSLLGLYLLRMRHITRSMQRELEVQHAERERIARDLHDTLLQSVQGLLLKFQSVAERIPVQDGGARDAMEAALDRADQVLAEARDRVLELRSPDAEGDLQAALVCIGQELAKGQPVALRTVIEGEPRPLIAQVQDQALAIGREALFNAFQHARAGSVEIEIGYGGDELRMRVRDDGVGIDSAAMESHHRPRHWGLRGMHERAHAIGGALRVWGRAGAGTEVELVVPAAVAYPSPARQGLRQWLLAAMRLGRWA